MNERLLADLEAFEAGGLAREDLAATHGGEVASLLTMHDRMFAAAATMTEIDADAGWEALRGQLDAVVIPLVARKRSRRRTVAIALAAAMMLAGAAFAATWAGWFDEPVVLPRQAGSSTFGSGLGSPGASSADRIGDRPEQPSRGPDGDDEAPGGDPGSGDDPPAPGDGTAGGNGGPPGDDPDDHDQGTGNDGDHDDQGGGNDGQEGDQGGGPGDHPVQPGSQGGPAQPPGA